MQVHFLHRQLKQLQVQVHVPPQATEAAAAAPTRKSTRTSSNAKQVLSEEEDQCEYRRHFGRLSMPNSVSDLGDQGCFCPKGCTGSSGGECVNQVPVIITAECVEVTGSEGGYGRYLKAIKPIHEGELITIFGGATVKRYTHRDAYDQMTTLHEKGGVKFQYSVQVGSASMQDSQGWVIPPQDLSLLKDIMKRPSQLNNLVTGQPQAEGLGHYVQHTCCPKCVNAYIFPVYILREAMQQCARSKRRKHDEYMDLQCVAIRAQKFIKQGDEILMHYVGSGRPGGFDNVFKCVCCKCRGFCHL